MANIIKSDELRNNKTCANCKYARLICMKDGTPDGKYFDVVICSKDGAMEDVNSVMSCWMEDK